MMLRDTPAKTVCARAMQPVGPAYIQPPPARLQFLSACGLLVCVAAVVARRQPGAGGGSGGVRFVGIVVDASGGRKPCGFQNVFCTPTGGFAGTNGSSAF